MAQFGTLAHQYAEGPWRHLGVKRALVLLADAVEFRAVIGNEPREYVEAAGGALGIAQRRHPASERQPFKQWNDVDTAAFQHPAVADVHLVHREVFEPLLDRRVFSRQETGADPVRDGTQPKVQARRLILIVPDRLYCDDFPGGFDEILELLGRQYPGRMRCCLRVGPRIVTLSRGIIGVSEYRACGIGHEPRDDARAA